MNDLDACVDFLQRLIRTPGLPGKEEETAELVRAEMEALGYAEVRVDEMGNVVGRVGGSQGGSGGAPMVMFNTHLDHVDAGDESGWPRPPFGGEIDGGRVWGRGAVDIKGPLAAQVHGVGRLAGAGEPPAGDVWVTAVVQEEIGGVGARHLAETLWTPVVVVGEPSRNTLRRGHRGRIELVLRVVGRSVHASVPEKGVNPLESLARFILGLAKLEHPVDPVLGASSVAPTLLATDQQSANVVPGEVWQTLDWRTVPGQSDEEVRQRLEEILAVSLGEGAEGEITIPVYRRETYTGRSMEIPGSNPAYVLGDEHPAVVAAAEILADVSGGEAQPGIWKFATDGGHFARAGMAPVGVGPGDEFLAHTNREHVEIDELAAALDINEALARRLGARAAELGLGSERPESI